jgi:hypothetical protein
MGTKWEKDVNGLAPFLAAIYVLPTLLVCGNPTRTCSLPPGDPTMVKPLQAYRIISIIAFTLLLTTCILLLLVGLSLTIIKPIYLINVKSTSNVSPPTTIATQLRFGVWGVCAYK